MLIEAYLEILLQQGASDLILTAGAPPTMRKDGTLVPIAAEPLRPEHTEKLAQEVLPDDRWEVFGQRNDLDFSFNWKGRARFRISAFRQRGSVGLVLTLIAYRIPTFDELGLPRVIRSRATRTQGMILVAGPTVPRKYAAPAAGVH